MINNLYLHILYAILINRTFHFMYALVWICLQQDLKYQPAKWGMKYFHIQIKGATEWDPDAEGLQANLRHFLMKLFFF